MSGYVVEGFAHEGAIAGKFVELAGLAQGKAHQVDEGGGECDRKAKRRKAWKDLTRGNGVDQQEQVAKPEPVEIAGKIVVGLGERYEEQVAEAHDHEEHIVESCDARADAHEHEPAKAPQIVRERKPWVLDDGARKEEEHDAEQGIGYAKKVIDGEEEQNEKHQIRKGIKKFLP